jgi:hypothetical protein
LDGDGCAEIVITSPWGIGVLKQRGNSFGALMLAPNGTRFGGWLLNTTDNHFQWAYDVDGDHCAEIMVTSPWGIGLLALGTGTLDCPVICPNGTCFDGWVLNTADNRFGPVADLDGDGCAEIVITSPWGIGVLKQRGNSFGALMLAPNGMRFGGWLLNTADDGFGPAGDMNGDGRAEFMVKSPWGVGTLAYYNSLTCLTLHPHGTQLGDWISDNHDIFVGMGHFTKAEQRSELLLLKLY